MTDKDLAEIKARADAATPGPWSADFTDDYGERRVDDGAIMHAGGFPYGTPEKRVAEIFYEREADVILMMDARDVIPALLAEVERLREIARAVAEADTLAYESDAGDDQRCTLCGGAQDEHGHWLMQHVWDYHEWKHAADCPVTKARALLSLENK